MTSKLTVRNGLKPDLFIQTNTKIIKNARFSHYQNQTLVYIFNIPPIIYLFLYPLCWWISCGSVTYLKHNFNNVILILAGGIFCWTHIQPLRNRPSGARTIFLLNCLLKSLHVSLYKRLSVITLIINWGMYTRPINSKLWMNIPMGIWYSVKA